MGAENFLVFNLPDLGDIPFAFPPFTPPGTDVFLSGVTAAHNALLDAELAALAASLVDLDLFFFDVNALIADILATLAAYGLVAGNVPGPASGCLFGAPCPDFSLDFDTPAAGLFFWDEQHPTSAAHALIADGALAALDIPEPGTLAVFAFGIAALGASTARRRIRA